MTQVEYGTAYLDGRNRTVRFLLSRGLSEDAAKETAQAAWARGWERRAQIRDDQKTLTWVNSIALNLYRSQLRREQKHEPMREMSVPPRVSLDSIDACLLLDRCRRCDRELLVRRYLFGYEIRELARDQGCTTTAVRVRLMRARRVLRRLFEGDQRLHGARAAATASPGKRRSRKGNFWLCRQAA